MCGIAGIISRERFSKQKRIVRQMCNALSHRGPDDVGYYEENGIVFGHRRLSIIDIEGGHQPLSNEDGSIWVALNGEIYNYLELRSELTNRGHRFSTTTDTETIVHLYEDFGINLLKKLNGMFAFALWDAKSRIFYLVRDRLGIKPLYYSVLHGKLAFASELKALLYLEEIGRDINIEAIAEYITLNYVKEPLTPFKQIRKLSSGCYIEYKDGRSEERRYWRIPTPVGEPNTSIDEICEQIRFLVKDATRLQLRSDVPIGIYASGGIDSTALMWGAAQNDISIEAFFCEFDDLKEDSQYARLAAAATGIELREAHLSAKEANTLLPKLIWNLDEPLADVAVIPAYLIAKQAASRVKVILNGTGGDELFGGYPRYNVRAFLPVPWSEQIGMRLDALSHGHPAVRKMAAALDYRQRYYHRMCIVPEAEVRNALGLNGKGKVRQFVAKLFAESDSRDISGSMMFVDLNTYLPGDLFMLLDKMTMAVSLEARVPLLDHRLVEFVARLPGELKMRGKNLKWLLRRALKGHLPDVLLNRPKKGFGPPVNDWINGSIGKAALDLLISPEARINKLLGSKQISDWIRPQKRVSFEYASRVWTLLVLELWWRCFVDSEDLSDASIYDLSKKGKAVWI